MASGSYSGAKDANGFWITGSWSESSQNVDLNTSVVTASYVLNHASAGMFSSWTLTTWLKISWDVDGGPAQTVTIHSSHKQYSMPNKTLSIGSGSYTIPHDLSGAQNVTITAYVDADTNASYVPVGTSVSSGSVALDDFARLPAAPGAPSFDRSNPALIGVTSAVPASALPITDYNFRVSTDNSTWSADQAMGSGGYATYAATATQPYYFQTRAYSSEGWGSYGASGFIAGVPTAPSAINLVRNARNVTVSISASTSNGGATITSYTVEYNDGSGWGNAQNITSGSYTYTNLPAGKTYQFRTWATNSTGNSGYTSFSIFVPAGGKRWDGSSFVSTSTAKRWDGSAWVDVLTAKRWDGATWVDLS